VAEAEVGAVPEANVLAYICADDALRRGARMRRGRGWQPAVMPSITESSGETPLESHDPAA
jgi:hypothetical protein